MNSVTSDLKELFKAIGWYNKRKFITVLVHVDNFKGFSVDVLMKRRGEMRKRIWHGSMVGLASVGIISSGVLGGQNLVSSYYPGVAAPDPRFVDSFEPYPNGAILQGSQDTHTDISQKPRSEIVEYEVQDGDTLSSIAVKFGITVDTIKWANNLNDIHQIKPGQQLKILPVSGVTHTVKSGDTLESVAKKYQANAQAILDFPFNDVPDDFSLKSGQLLIIPDGQAPEKPASRPRTQPQYIAQRPPSVSSPIGGGQFIWPTNGVITQYFSWYHSALDIANSSAPVIVAADSGVVVVAGWPDSYGFGNRVVIDHGNNYKTLYAHMSNIYVSVGQSVGKGQVVGQMGSTGRSTGTHLHFEIYYKGVPQNPLSLLR